MWMGMKIGGRDETGETAAGGNKWIHPARPMNEMKMENE
jgi:hypothetical protein